MLLLSFGICVGVESSQDVGERKSFCSFSSNLFQPCSNDPNMIEIIQSGRGARVDTIDSKYAYKSTLSFYKVLSKTHRTNCKK